MIPDKLDDVDFTLSCSEIRFPDRRYRYYPQVKLYIREQGEFSLYDQTEIVRGNKSPVFQQKFKIPYNPGVVLSLKFELVDSPSPEDQKFLGQAIITSEELVRTNERSKTIEIMSLIDKVCDLTLQWHPSANPSKDILISFEGVDLKYHTAWFLKPDVRPFFRLGRWMSDEEYLTVYESNIAEETRNPKWKSFKVKTSNLSKGDSKNPIKFMALHYENGSEKNLGEGYFTLEQILQGHALIHLEDKSKQKHAGTIRVKCQIIQKTTGINENKIDSKLNFMMGIDFSDTQRRIHGLESTHLKSTEEGVNQHQVALNELFDLFFCLNAQQAIPCYGFGSLKASSSSKTRKEDGSSYFSITGNPSNSLVSDLNDLMEAYNKQLTSNLSGGQANFSEIIQKATYLAKFNQLRGTKEYVVLVLLTDGTIEDLENTLNSMIQAANLPLSVIIIGVGESDFDSFESLDRQLGLCETVRRDYVSFFAYKDFEGDINKLKSKIQLEIPEQILEYIETEHSLFEESRDSQKEIPAYLKDDLYKTGREYSKARKQIDGLTRRSIKLK